jgi:hypothetical protein
MRKELVVAVYAAVIAGLSAGAPAIAGAAVGQPEEASASDRRNRLTEASPVGVLLQRLDEVSRVVDNSKLRTLEIVVQENRKLLSDLADTLARERLLRERRELLPAWWEAYRKSTERIGQLLDELFPA